MGTLPEHIDDTPAMVVSSQPTIVAIVASSKGEADTIKCRTLDLAEEVVTQRTASGARRFGLIYIEYEGDLRHLWAIYDREGRREPRIDDIEDAKEAIGGRWAGIDED